MRLIWKENLGETKVKIIDATLGVITKELRLDGSHAMDVQLELITGGKAHSLVEIRRALRLAHDIRVNFEYSDLDEEE